MTTKENMHACKMAPDGRKKKPLRTIRLASGLSMQEPQEKYSTTCSLSYGDCIERPLANLMILTVFFGSSIGVVTSD